MKNFYSFVILTILVSVSLSLQVKQDDCIILYSKCNYEGDTVNICEDTPELTVEFEIKSIYIPDGKDFYLYEETQYNGKETFYSQSVSCIEKAAPEDTAAAEKAAADTAAAEKAAADKAAAEKAAAEAEEGSTTDDETDQVPETIKEVDDDDDKEDASAVSDKAPEELPNKPQIEEIAAADVPEDLKDGKTGDDAEAKDKDEIKADEKVEADNEAKNVKLNLNANAEIDNLNSPVNFIGQIISFSSLNFPKNFIRHQNYVCFIHEIKSDLDKKDASFFVRVSLRGVSNAVSFESTNFPGFYLQHDATDRFKIAKFENKPDFKKRSSFYLKKGLAQDSSFSLESTLKRGFYIRHRNFELWLDKLAKTDIFSKDATFAFFPGFYQPASVAQNYKVLLQHSRYLKFIRPRVVGRRVLQVFNRYAAQKEEFYLVFQGNNKYCIKQYNNAHFLARAGNGLVVKANRCSPVVLNFLPQNKNSVVRQVIIQMDKFYMTCAVRCWFSQKNIKKAHTFNFIDVTQVTKRVYFKTTTGFYLTAEGAGGRELVADRKAGNAWEEFTLIPTVNGQYCMRSINQYKFVGVGKNKQARAEFDNCQPMRLVYLKEQTKETQVSLLFGKQYLCAEGNGGGAVNINRDVNAGWETFTMIDVK